MITKALGTRFKKFGGPPKKHLVVICRWGPHADVMSETSADSRVPGAGTTPLPAASGATAASRPSPRTLWRFPGPIALARGLDGQPPRLHHADADEVYLGDMTLWDWPGVDEFGALSIFDAARLAPRPGPVAGWFVAAPTALDAAAVLYVPDRRCAAAVAGAPDAAAARARLPAHYVAAVAESRRAMERYDAVSRRVADRLQTLDVAGAGLEALPEHWHDAARTPLHMLPPARREGLARALARAVRGVTSRQEAP